MSTGHSNAPYFTNHVTMLSKLVHVSVPRTVTIANVSFRTRRKAYINTHVVTKMTVAVVNGYSPTHLRR